MAGNLWRYSHQLDDEDLLFAQREYISLKAGTEYYGIGMKRLDRIAHEAGAVYKIGNKMVRINRLMLEEYFRKIWI